MIVLVVALVIDLALVIAFVIATTLGARDRITRSAFRDESAKALATACDVSIHGGDRTLDRSPATCGDHEGDHEREVDHERDYEHDHDDDYDDDVVTLKDARAT